MENSACCREESRSLLPLAIAFGLFATGFLVPDLLALPPWAQPLWMAVATLIPFVCVLKEAWEELCDRHMGENGLLVIAVVSAFAIGECVEGAMVVLLFSLGEWVEDKATDYSRDAVSSLGAVTPDKAYRPGEDGSPTEIPAQSVAVGETLLIPPHTRIPVDLTVTAGESTVDTSLVTGESEPRAVSVGDELPAGAVNGDGTLTGTALRIAQESAAARIVRLVEESAAHKGKTEKFITRFARIYTPVVTALAVLVAVVPPLLAGGIGWSVWLYRALVFLVASCPCALVISVPLGFYAGIATAARQGVLLKGGNPVEALGRIKGVALDKTGTLTQNTLTLERVETAPGYAKETVLLWGSALENTSAHPIAHALTEAVSSPLPTVANRTEQAGSGITGEIDGTAVAVGGERLLKQYTIPLPEEWADASAFLVGNGQLMGAFFLSSPLQEGADTLVQRLKKQGIQRIMMLTGDRHAPALAVGKQAHIEEIHAGLLPEEKRDKVLCWEKAGIPTAFVGDGINDAPVLAAASVGFAMGLGSDAAMETADGILTSGGLSHLPGVIALCRRTMRRIRENIVFALGVKVTVLVLAVIGIAPMWLGVLADMGVTLLSVMNVLRLLHLPKE